MGIITDFFIATEQDAAALDLEGLVEIPYRTYAANGCDPIKLATLQAIHQGIDVDNIDAVSGLIPDELCVTEDGVAIVPVPDALVDAWASWSDAALEAIGRRWGQTEELELDGWSEEATFLFLREVRAFLQHPRPANAKVWLYVSP